VALVMGSATVYGVLKAEHEKVALIAAGIVTVLSAINLVVGSARQARLHHDLARSFIALERKMIATPNPDETMLAAWTIERLEIEEDEPPKLHVLDCICHNDLMRAMGHSPKEFALRWRVDQRVEHALVDAIACLAACRVRIPMRERRKRRRIAEEDARAHDRLLSHRLELPRASAVADAHPVGVDHVGGHIRIGMLDRADKPSSSSVWSRLQRGERISLEINVAKVGGEASIIPRLA
jgi:hypothetical protein